MFGSVSMAVSLGLIDFLVKTILYYIHEMSWETTTWGLNKKYRRIDTDDK